MSPSVLPLNNQEQFPLGWTGWISLQHKGLSRVLSNTTVQKHQFFGDQFCSHHFMGNRWGNNGNSHRLYFLGLQNHCWRRKWQPTPIFLRGEFHGQRSLESYSPWGHKESDMTRQPSTSDTQALKCFNSFKSHKRELLW